MQPWRNVPGLVLGVFLLTACQPEADQEQAAGAENEPAEESAEESPAIPVEVAFATRGDVFATYTGTAPVEAFQDAVVIAKVGGEVRELFAEEGDEVKAGQVLARLDGDRLRFEQQQTEANLRKLQRDYERNVDLRERGLISDGDFEEIQFQMQALEATNNLAKLELSYAEIRAPFDGVVSERLIKLGNTLEQDAETFKITSLEPLISYLHVPEREFRTIKKGQRVGMIIDALNGATFEGTVARVSPVVDPETGTFKIAIEVSDESRRLKPGMFARIAIVQDAHLNVLKVPRSAVLTIGGVDTIYVVEDNVAARRTVTTGYSHEGQVEIVEGITDTDRFVVVGQTGLKNGSRVSVINDDKAVPAAARNET